eukprot:240722_1
MTMSGSSRRFIRNIRESHYLSAVWFFKLGFFLIFVVVIAIVYQVYHHFAAKVEVPRIVEESMQFIRKEGFPVEEHFAYTSDGYILRIFRIRHGRTNANLDRHKKPRPAMLLIHGLFDSAMGWLVNGGSESLGFMLADAGYDVWLGNVRGNTYSRNHTYLPIEATNDLLSGEANTKFWDYSFVDHCRKDMPAMVNKVLSVTRHDKIGYVGFSQGTTTFFGNMGSSQSMHDKLWGAFIMAPAVRVNGTHSSSALWLGQHAPGMLIGRHQVMDRDHALVTWNRFVQWWYRDSPNKFEEFMYDGMNLGLYNRTKVHDYMRWFPAGTSQKNVRHWLQLCETGLFRDFNYGHKRNIEMYGQSNPPSLNFTGKPFPPVVVFASRADTVAPYHGARWVIKHIPKKQLRHVGVLDHFGHRAFILSKYAAFHVYKPIIKHANILCRENGCSSRAASMPTVVYLFFCVLCAILFL